MDLDFGVQLRVFTREASKRIVKLLVTLTMAKLK